MTDQDFTNVLDHLFTQLRQLQLEDVLREINSRINRGKTITPDVEELRVKKIKQQEVGKTQTLPLTAKEALEVAVDHLSKVIIEVPVYAQKISATFGNDVEWESDQTELIKSLDTAANSFSLAEFTFPETEIEAAKRQIDQLKNLLNEN